MDQELMTIIQNIESLIQQAKQAAGGEGEDATGSGAVTPDMLDKIMRALGDEKAPEDKKEDDMEAKLQKCLKIMKGEDEESPEDEKEDKAEELNKCNVKKSAEGSTSSDSAETNLDDLPEVTEDNINEVAKTIAGMLARKKVAKSNPTADMFKIMKSLADELHETKKAVGGILEGLGIADQIIKPVVQKSRPMNSIQEIQKSLDIIKERAGQKAEVVDDQTGNSSHYIAKSFAKDDGSLLRGIFTKYAR